jgi:PEP-CTERM motif
MSTIKRLFCASALALVVATGASAGQTTLNFDDIAVSGGNEAMPVGYGGFSWDANIWVMTQDFYQALYSNTVSFPTAPIAFYNGPGAVSVSIARATPFEFVSLQAALFARHDTADENSSASITVEGFRNGVLVGSDSLTLGINFATVSSTFASTPVDTLVLLNDGVDEHWWVADNLTYMAAAPEPQTWAMMLIGLAGLGFAALKRRKARAVVERPAPTSS